MDKFTREWFRKVVEAEKERDKRRAAEESEASWAIRELWELHEKGTLTREEYAYAAAHWSGGMFIFHPKDPVYLKIMKAAEGKSL